MTQVYVDLDGVLADFDTGYLKAFGVKPDKTKDVGGMDWKLVRNTQGFYANLPPMPDFMQLWRYVEEYDPIILTGVPRDVPEAADNKRAWVTKNIGDVPMIGCLSKEKSKHCKPGDILIDDWEKYRDLWLAKGGVWITHRSAIETILDLMVMGL